MKYLLKSEQIKNNAIDFIRYLPTDKKFFYEILIKKRTRSLEQNAKFHAICDELELSGLKWFGKERSSAEWKVLLISGHTKATEGDVELVLGLEGELVNIREETSKMNVSRASSLIEYTLAFCAENNIKLKLNYEV